MSINKKRAPVITGVSQGHHLSEIDIQKIRQYNPYGVVLRKDNLTIPFDIDKESQNATLSNLIAQITNAYGYTPVIWIDQEGGRVQRLNTSNVGRKKYPPAADVGKVYENDPSLALEMVTNNYTEITQELLSWGIKGNFAPVADIWYPQLTTSALGDRLFSQRSEIVSSLATAAYQAIEKAGGLACFKHIPGHGRTSIDSHYTLPTIREQLAELYATDFNVMKNIAQIQPKHAMVAHIIYTAIDQHLPSTISPAMIEFMRHELGFGPDTLFISDAMDMKAIAVYGTPDQLLLQSLAAGMDIVLDYAALCTIDGYSQIPLDKYI